MYPIFFKQTIRLVFIFLLQVLVLKRINLSFSEFNYIFIYICPLFIILLPIKVNRILQLTLALVLGLAVDMFYDSPGLHTAALVLTAYLKKIVLKFLEPVEGYTVESSLGMVKYGFNWFLIYSSMLLFVHLFVYFMLEAFAFQFILGVLLRTVFSFIISQVLILLYMVLMRPK